MARGKNPLAQLTGCDSTAQRILSVDSSMGIGVLVPLFLIWTSPKILMPVDPRRHHDHLPRCSRSMFDMVWWSGIGDTVDDSLKSHL